MAEIRIMFLGKLGDACKKLAELQLLAQDQTTNNLLAIDIKAFKQTIEAWPTPNVGKEVIDAKCAQLRIELVRLRSLETELNEQHTDLNSVLLESAFYTLKSCVKEYLLHLEYARSIVAELNKAGSSGTVDLEIKEAQDSPVSAGT